MEDVKIVEKNTIIGGVLSEYDVNVVRLAIDLALDHCSDSFSDEDRASLVNSDKYFKEVIVKSKTVGR